MKRPLNPQLPQRQQGVVWSQGVSVAGAGEVGQRSPPQGTGSRCLLSTSLSFYTVKAPTPGSELGTAPCPDEWLGTSTSSPLPGGPGPGSDPCTLVVGVQGANTLTGPCHTVTVRALPFSPVNTSTGNPTADREPAGQVCPVTGEGRPMAQHSQGESS